MCLKCLEFVIESLLQYLGLIYKAHFQTYRTTHQYILTRILQQSTVPVSFKYGYIIRFLMSYQYIISRRIDGKVSGHYSARRQYLQQFQRAVVFVYCKSANGIVASSVGGI